jgi:hypothetical protein
LISKKNIFWLVAVLIPILLIEIMSYFGCLYLQSKGVIYNPVIREDYSKYLEDRDTLLGWPYPNSFGIEGEFDITGSRIVSEFPDPLKTKTLISMYGDSFTYGHGVPHDSTWANYLSQLLNKRVANFGVGAYGTDQAYLRFLRNREDSSKIVLLNHFSMDIIRNVNQYRDIIAATGGLAFKPRFVLNSKNKLELIPLAYFDKQKYKDVISNPKEYFPYEYFFNSGSYGFVKFEFPYTLTLIQSFNHFRVQSRISGVNYYNEFYRDNHPSQALEITLLILDNFVKEAKNRGQIPIITLVPNRGDIEFYFKEGSWPYSNLLTHLINNKVEVINLGDRLSEYYQDIGPCGLYINCSGHFNGNGNKILANITFNYLMKEKYLELLD